MNDCVIIIFGASGDLAKRKLLPALFRLTQKHLFRNFCIIGAAFDDTTADTILEQSQLQSQEKSTEFWSRFKDRFFYHKLNFTQADDYTILKDQIDAYKKRCNLVTCNTIIYFATSSHFFCDITTNIAQTGIAPRSHTDDTTWTRLIYEKPFGHDLASARAVNTCIATYFNEDQIYRIDHYLTKELVGNIALVRFTNLIFEPLWNNRYIDQVQIILAERENIGNRGQYYDHFGAIKDVMQNHMLELLALIGMETPKTLYGNDIRDARAQVLQKVRVGDLFVAQYDGYKDAAFISKTSTTETFAAALLYIDNPRWANVPFFLKTGKCLSKKETSIHIKFKPVECLLSNCSMDQNVLTIEISPRAGFVLRLNAKKVGEANEVVPVSMEFCHSCIFGDLDNRSYETLIENVIKGEQSVSVRFDEIEYAWNSIETLKQKKAELFYYKPGSDGPTEIEQFNQKHNVRWLS